MHSIHKVLKILLPPPQFVRKSVTKGGRGHCICPIFFVIWVGEESLSPYIFVCIFVYFPEKEENISGNARAKSLGGVALRGAFKELTNCIHLFYYLVLCLMLSFKCSTSIARSFLH